MFASRVRREILVTALDAVVLLVLSELLAGFVLDGLGSALLAAVLVGVLNALVWPVLARLSLQLNVIRPEPTSPANWGHRP